MSIDNKPHVLWILLLISLFTLFALNVPLAAAQQEPWTVNWGVPEGFAIEAHTQGYALPSAIAFIPDPGDGPKDPLYFVTELRGVIKVVTNDRSVYTFAQDFFPVDPEQGMAVYSDEFGLAGICLDPENGYVFVTYAYRSGGKKMRNNVARFETAPGTFSLEPKGMMDFREVFFPFTTDASHQIGNCRVHEGLLYVSVGDGLNQETLPIALESLRGKILRFTLDGQPAPGNPFSREDDPQATVNYVWATGFRNPFGIEIVDGRVFIADNGGSIDRFLEARPGEDYLWDGSDWSLGSAADAVFNPSIGPTQLHYLAPGQTALPSEYDDSFFIAMTGGRVRGVMQLDYDIETSRVRATPSVFVRYIGPEPVHHAGIVPAMDIGPDGLYFAPMLEAGVETGTVYRVYFDPDNPHPFHPDDLNNPEVLLATKNCLACHSLAGTGGFLGPALDYPLLTQNLTTRLRSSEYLQLLDEVDALTEEPYVSHTESRQEMRTLHGTEQMRHWIYYHLLEPKFDNPEAQMPNLGLSSDQALALADFLLTPASEAGGAPAPSAETADVGVGTAGADSDNPIVRLVANVIPVVGYRHLLVFFAVGLVLGGVGWWLFNFWRKKRRT